MNIAITTSDDADFSPAADVDVVLDYIWGEPAKKAMQLVLRSRKDPNKVLKWVEIGSTAGLEMSLLAALLRASNLHILGSTPGTFSTSEMEEKIPKLIKVIIESGMTQSVEVKKLTEIEEAWSTNPDAKLVFEP